MSVSKRRLQALRQVDELAASLKDEEVRVRAGMDAAVGEVTKDKAICLFRALLEETGFPDPGVADMLVHGVQLVGEEPPSPIFAKRPRLRAISPSDLLAQAALWRESIKHVRGLMDPADLETGLEIEAGFLARPYAS